MTSIAINDSRTTAEALAESGLLFNVFKLPLVAVDELNSLEIGTDLVANCRMLSDKEGKSQPHILGIVKQSYSVMQNEKAFAAFDPFLETGAAKIVESGCFNHGSKVFLLAELNRSELEVVPGDVVRPFMLMANSHDGSIALSLGFVPKRGSCANWLNMVLRSTESRLIKIRHKGNIEVNLEKARDVMNIVNQDFIMTVDQYKELAKVSVNADQFKQYVKSVFSQELKEEAEEESRKSRIIDALEKAYETSPGNDASNVRGTAWAAYNAVTYYNQYVRGNSKTTDEKRLDNVWFGQAKTINAKALEKALALV